MTVFEIVVHSKVDNWIQSLALCILAQTKGVNPGGDGGDISPPCFDMEGIRCLLSPPPHVLTPKSVGFLFWKINNVL